MKSGNITSGCDITDSFHHQDEVDCKQGEDERSIDREREGVYPDERCYWCGVDTTLVKVTTGGGNDTANEQTEDNAHCRNVSPRNQNDWREKLTRFHNRSTESLEYDNADED